MTVTVDIATDFASDPSATGPDAVLLGRQLADQFVRLATTTRTDVRALAEAVRGLAAENADLRLDRARLRGAAESRRRAIQVVEQVVVELRAALLQVQTERDEAVRFAAQAVTLLRGPTNSDMGDPWADRRDALLARLEASAERPEGTNEPEDTRLTDAEKDALSQRVQERYSDPAYVQRLRDQPDPRSTD